MPSFTAPEQEIEFECFCGSCGAGICQNVTTKKTNRRNLDAIEIMPCKKCLEKAESQSFDEGYKEGFEAGFAEGESSIS